MKNPFKRKKNPPTTPYTWDKPYIETRTVETPTFSKDGDGDDWITLHFDYRESWKLCLNQWKRLGMPLPGDKIVIRLSNKRDSP